jgi:DNA-binding NtrC family response regulator
MYSFMRPPENTVLIVDDNSLHLTIYRWILEREGYHCRTALVGNTSVELPVSERIDLVLLDYRLSSSLTAPEVAEQAKSAFPEAQIVVLSELPWMPDDIRPYAAAFVNKGEPKRLIETLARVLRGEPSPA